MKKQSLEAERDRYPSDEGSQDVLHGITCAAIIGPDDEFGAIKPVVYTITGYRGEQATRGYRGAQVNYYVALSPRIGND